jgi:hypothetical protein
MTAPRRPHHAERDASTSKRWKSRADVTLDEPPETGRRVAAQRRAPAQLPESSLKRLDATTRARLRSSLMRPTGTSRSLMWPTTAPETPIADSAATERLTSPDTERLTSPATERLMSPDLQRLTSPDTQRLTTAKTERPTEAERRTERLVSWANFPEPLQPSTTPWHHRPVVAIAAGCLGVVGLIVLVAAVVLVSNESTRPATIHPGVLTTPPTPATTTAPPATATAPPTVPDAPANPAPPANDNPAPPPNDASPAPPPNDSPAPPGDDSPTPPATESPPTFARQLPTSTARPWPPRWWRRLYPYWPPANQG